jgi:putative polyhydroxyalkanoate system protein
MSDIKFVRRHTLTIAQARTVVQKAADEFAGEYGVSCEWRGNTLHFHRSGIDGRVHVTDSEFHLEVTLGFMMRRLKGRIVAHIERDLDQALEERLRRASTRKPARKTARHAR